MPSIFIILYAIFLLSASLALVAALRDLVRYLRGSKQIRIKQWPNSESDACHYFTPKKKVEWFDFMGLLHSFKRVSLSSDTLSIIDKREVEASFGKDPRKEVNETQKDLWIDFMADTGDGINGTASVFSAITRESLSLNFENGRTEKIPRGEILIIGGDLVYPVANEQSYNDRLKGPIRLLFPNLGGDATSQPFLLATPGNHDWYDGLNAFFRLICQQKNIGNYKTSQNRSYFAYRLLKNVHIMGIDNQLMGDVDIPQMNYFNDYSSELKSIPGEHNIIILVAEPYWYNFMAEDTGKRRQRMDSLTYFITQITEKNENIKVRMVISGDMHHYSRYENTGNNCDVKEYVTSGGGGAFMHMTDFLRPDILLPSFKTGTDRSPLTKGTTKPVFFPTATYECKKTYPSKEQSKNHNRENLLFAYHNYKFVVMVLLVSLLSLYLLDGRHDNLLITLGFLAVPVFFLFIIFKTLPAEQSKSEKILSYIWMTLLLFFSVLINYLVLCRMPSPQFAFKEIVALNQYIESIFKASIIAIPQTILFGLYLFLSYRISQLHITEASSSCVNEGYKNFLRMHISEKGIEVYAIGIKKAQNWWKMLQKQSPQSITQLQKDMATGDNATEEKYFGKGYQKDNLFLIDRFSVPFR